MRVMMDAISPQTISFCHIKQENFGTNHSKKNKRERERDGQYELSIFCETEKSGVSFPFIDIDFMFCGGNEWCWSC